MQPMELSQLFNYVKTVTIPEMEGYLSEFSEEELTQSLRDSVYSSNTGSYENTYSLLSAIDTERVNISSGSNTEIDLYTAINEKKMKNDYASYYENWNEDNRENIVGWLNDGHGGYYKGYSITYAGRKFIETTQKVINKTAKSKLSKFLKTIGYRIGK